jgi:hypothetical protein
MQGPKPVSTRAPEGSRAGPTLRQPQTLCDCKAPHLKLEETLSSLGLRFSTDVIVFRKSVTRKRLYAVLLSQKSAHNAREKKRHTQNTIRSLKYF